jgi:hypothetical protein
MNKNKTESENPWSRVEAPTVTRAGLHGEKHTHPAFGTIIASRVSGQANLFGSNVGQSGFVKIAIHPAEMYRDGYSENIHGSLSTIAEVCLSEAQWVAFISRMNVGSGTPCTIRQYGGRDSHVICPNISDPELPADRLKGRVAELEERNLRRVDEQIAEIRALCEGLPKKKAEAIIRAAGLMSVDLRRNHEFAGETLRKYTETLVTESKIEIDAMLTDAVSRFGLESIQQLGHILSSDPAKAMKLLSNDGGEQADTDHTT